MTKKHFKEFAKDFKAVLELILSMEGHPSCQAAIKRQIERQIDSFCVIAAKFNPNFNPTTFRKACGL